MKKKWVRAQSLVLIAILFVLALPKLSIPTYAYLGGSGTASDPYLVATPQDLINVGNHTDKYYLQICDISMEGYSFTPISTFTGTYDGNGYAVQDLSINSYSAKVGLFAINYGTIQNLHLQNCEIITTTLTDVVFCGGIAGRNYQGGEVINCSVSGTVTGKSHGYNTEVYVGGLVGLNQGLIQNCCNFAEVNGTSFNAALDAYAGGIVGNNNTTSIIKNCSNEGLVRATNGRNCLAGGIAGINHGTVSGVMNSAEIYAESSVVCDGYRSDAYAAGAVAYNKNYVAYAQNSGFVHASSSADSAEAGGIVAYNGDAPYEPGPYIVEKSINTGEVLARSTAGESRAGGIAATSYMNSYVRYCCNMGNVSATENVQYNLAIAGGLVGSLMYATMIESCNHGNVTVSATQYDAQVCGLATTTEAVIKNCYNTGDVFVNSTPVRYSNGQGAMLFIDSDTTCLNCYSTGAISKSHSQNECRGLYGTTGGTDRNTVQDCFTTESIGTPAASLISAEQAKQRSTFTNYDFNGTWAIDPAINGGLPYLRNIPDESDNGWFVDPSELVAVNGIELAQSQISPALGQTVKLVATVLPIDATNQNVRWESTDAGVASVDQSGVVTVNGFGNATIRVITDDGGFIASCTVSVPASYPSFSGGTGTSSNPYLISTAQDVANMHYRPSAHYKLTNDISLDEVDVVPIGTTNRPFSGTFNGDGYCLSNLTLTADGNRTYLALFGCTTGSITDLCVKNFTVSGTSATNHVYCAALVAYAESGKIENCHVIATVNATAPGEQGAAYAGGLVAASGVAQIKGCSFSGQVSSKVIEIDSNAYSGGICAHGDATVENCQNYGSIRAEGAASCDVYAGGIVGYASGNVTQCYNKGNVEGVNSRGSYVGGITGQNQGNVYSCTNCGEIYASTAFKDFNDDVRSYAGGISGSNFGTVQYGYNEGSVHSHSTSAHAYAGGVVGYCQAESYIYYSKNKGEVKAGSTGGESRAGGIASTCYTDGAVKYCCNEGSVSIYDNPYYWGGYAGGILAVLQYGTLSECCNHGTVTIDSTAYMPYGNGIAAFSEAIFNNCYSDGNVHSAFARHESYNSGMICGIGTGHDTPVETCYFAGELTSDYSYTEKYGLIHTNGQGGNTVTSCYAFALYGSAGEGRTMSREDSVLQSTYQNYNFTSVWAIDPAINEGRPYLRRVPTDADANWYSGSTEQPSFHKTHTASNWVVALEPSCIEDGYRYMICTECGETFNEEITPAYGHAWSDWYFTKYPTCTATGTENRECYSCNAIESRSAAAYGHDYALTVTPPTCTEQGYTTYTCTACGDSYVDDFTEAMGHSYKDGVCTVCGVAISSWEIGTIASANGLDQRGDSRMRTVGYLKLTDCIGVGIGQGYTMTNFVYDENYNYLGTSSWIGNGMPFTTAELKEKYPTGVYFRVVFRALDQRTLSEASVEESGVKFYFLGEQIPEPDLGFAYKDVASIGGWQDGAVFNGKLFALGAAGKGAVYDVQTGATLGNFTLDRGDVLKPHANSVCFGSTYYRAGDQYPLLYVNIYNNYANAEDRMEGTCCVYRLTESEGNYTTELVQVIRIGFTENLTLWKSEENNGDIRPYGNFVVDTDQNKLYAYVMRDANQTIRFFSFDIPALDQGAYVDAYGCNLVTLAPDDIETQFDIGVYHYLQGCTYHSGMILMALDFGGDAPLCIVDLKTQRVIQTYYLGYAGLRSEPEVLCADPDTGVLYYAAADGMLRVLTLKNVHLHTYTSVTTPPTCTEQGYTTYTCECGESYVDDDTPALGHNMNEWSVTVLPTCTANGTQRRACSRCNHFEETSIPANGHTPSDWIVDTQPNCGTNGSRHKECKICGIPLETDSIPALNHTYESIQTLPTCTEQGYTTYNCECGESYVDDFTEATGHSFDEWITVLEPTCTANGTQRRDCARCDHFEELSIPANGHTPSDWIVDTQPNCSTDGSRHKECKICGIPLETDSIPALNHTYEPIQTHPTCTEQGYTTYTCTICKANYVDSYVDALGHSFTNYVSNNDATYTEDGTKTAKCDRCNEKKTITDEGSALGMAQRFRDEMAELNQNADTETTYGELYAILQTYASLSAKEKEDVAKEFATLQQMINAYNAKAQTANNELAEATEFAFGPIAATSFAFLAALWFLLRKKFLV